MTTAPPETTTVPGFRRLPRWITIAAVDVIARPMPRPSLRSRRSARGRKAIIAGVIAYLAFQSTLNLAIRNDVLPVRDPVWSEKFELLQKQPAFFAAGNDRPNSPVRVLAMGSSRTQLAFDATSMARTVSATTGREVEAFNFGCPAAGAMTSALYFRRLLAAGVEPDRVLIEIHPGFVAPMDPPSDSPFEARWLHTYRLRPDEVELLRGFGWNVASPPHHGWQGWLTASASYRMSLLNRYAPVMMTCPYGLTIGAKSRPDGYVRGQEMPRDRYPRALARTRLEYAPVLDNYRTGGPGTVAVADLLEQCRNHGIDAAIVLMPESSEHRVWYGTVGYRRVTEFATGLGEAFDAPVVDAREWVPDIGFADGHHLTATGATIYTNRLANEFVTPWIGHREDDR